MTPTSRFLTVALVLAYGTRARADSCDNSLYDGQHFFFYVCNVADFDQKRAAFGLIKGLPNNGGMYCAPTAALNWSAYIANHGYPAVSPGPGKWDGSPMAQLDEYNFITDNLLFMGGAMNTDPAKGTGGSASVNGLQVWLDIFSPGNFIVVGVFAKDEWSPRARDASVMAMFGGLVNLGMGWYTNADEPEAHVRKGGHAVTLVGGNNTDDPVGSAKGGLLLNDPARGSDSNLLTQSPFQYSGTAFNSETQYFCGLDKNNFVAGCVKRTQDRLTYTGSGYMDSYLAIIPRFGLSYDSDLILMRAVRLTPPGEAGRPLIQRFAPAIAGRVLDLALNPVRVKHPYLVEGSDVIWEFDALTGRSTPFARVPQGPRRLAYGRDETLYVLTPHQLESYDREGKRNRNIGLQDPLDAIAFDPVDRRVVGLSASALRLYAFDLSLSRTGSFALPPSTTAGAARWTLRADPSTGEMWMLAEGSRELIRLAIDRGGSIRTAAVMLPPELPPPQGFDIDEKGNLFVVARGAVYVLNRSAQLVRTSPFFGLQAGVGFQIARPYTNFDPAVHEGPSWVNVLPEDAWR